MRFTPRLADWSEERADMDLSEQDHAKVQRGKPWEATITDLNTGRSYVVRGADCSTPGCCCDAYVVCSLHTVRH